MEQLASAELPPADQQGTERQGHDEDEFGNQIFSIQHATCLLRSRRQIFIREDALNIFSGNFIFCSDC